eukprot:CAMPEP_0177667010 /NCGR_PEP_ID=MMETSP0447-20121125/21888_1 /TAXON_ID=0 /ORGANISM="Stygamoeba regulata, Strain BSH-02190019" /LENGTH=38 /DNA_ID= /DNA_START= /DNA_END= /DNA_ORIENTATION=
MVAKSYPEVMGPMNWLRSSESAAEGRALESSSAGANVA